MSKPKPDYVACDDCDLSPICSPVTVGQHTYDFTGQLVKRRHFFKRGEFIFQQGEAAQRVYAISAGSLKLTFNNRKSKRIINSERIIDFRFPGELLDICALENRNFPYSARALEDVYLCEIDKDSLIEVASQIPEVQGRLMNVVGKELSAMQRSSIILRGNLNSEEKLAAFLLHLGLRFKASGYSATQFTLTMTRADIANYLGLAKETVIRMMHKLQQKGLIQTKGKQLTLCKPEALQAMAGFMDPDF